MTRDNVDRTLQKGLVPVYTFAVAAGVSAMIFAPPTMLDVIGRRGAFVWGMFQLIGGLVCLGGVLMRRGARGDWFGEFVGIPLVATAVVIYGVVASRTLGGVPGRLAGIFLFGMLISLLVVRWLRVHDDGVKSTRPPTLPFP